MGKRIAGLMLVILSVWVFLHQVLGTANSAILGDLSGALGGSGSASSGGSSGSSTGGSTGGSTHGNPPPQARPMGN